MKLIDIYLITNKLNGMGYVGKTERGYLKRFEEHCEASDFGVHTYISNAIKKYGKENFDVKLLAQVADNSWRYFEKYYINLYGTHYSKHGYNITRGGDDNPMNDPLVRERHLAACRTPEKRAKQRTWTGKHHTEETKEKIRENNRKQADIILAGFRKYNTSRKQRVAMLDENGTVLKEFDSLSEATIYIGRDANEAGNIKRYADKYNKNGKRSKFAGYSWTLLK